MLKAHCWHCTQKSFPVGLGGREESIRTSKASFLPAMLCLQPFSALFLVDQDQDNRWLGSMFCCEELYQSTGLVPSIASPVMCHTPSPGPGTQEIPTQHPPPSTCPHPTLHWRINSLGEEKYQACADEDKGKDEEESVGHVPVLRVVENLT